jgi:hypothetical protein
VLGLLPLLLHALPLLLLLLLLFGPVSRGTGQHQVHNLANG